MQVDESAESWAKGCESRRRNAWVTRQPARVQSDNSSMERLASSNCEERDMLQRRVSTDCSCLDKMVKV